MAAKRYSVAQLDQVEGVPCPCGIARRAFLDDPDNDAASLHMTDIHTGARSHFHNKMTEIYYVLEGEGIMELDGDEIPLKPHTAIMIKPGCRHRALGKLRILNIPVPPFDEDDEWFDE